MADDGVPASPEVVAQAVAEARAALAQSVRPRSARPPAETRTEAPKSRPLPSQDEALANLYAALRGLRAAVSEVEAALAEASLYLADERTPPDE